MDTSSEPTPDTTPDMAALPAALQDLLDRRLGADDVDRAFVPDARVVDDGRELVGRDAVRDWLGGTVQEYDYTRAVRSAERVGEGEWLVVARLTGTFPGGVVDLAYRARVEGGRIAALSITAV